MMSFPVKRSLGKLSVIAAVDWELNLLRQAGAEVEIICKVKHDNLASRKVAVRA